MKYKVTVDGTAYVVEVEDLAGGAAPAPVAHPAPVPHSAPAPVAHPAPAPKPAAPVPAGGATITAPMPGKILKLVVAPGQAVKNGDLVLVLEAMKMENEIFATADGKVTDVRVKSGDSVNSGDVLIVLG